ncbi:Uncharacterised protein [Mycobacteroides abscessus subsp. abscessus]|nr:Uncharacterised protein [Mycobacteroides abscessus subsp. abscessus]
MVRLSPLAVYSWVSTRSATTKPQVKVEDWPDLQTGAPVIGSATPVMVRVVPLAPRTIGRSMPPRTARSLSWMTE